MDRRRFFVIFLTTLVCGLMTSFSFVNAKSVNKKCQIISKKQVCNHVCNFSEATKKASPKEEKIDAETLVSDQVASDPIKRFALQFGDLRSVVDGDFMDLTASLHVKPRITFENQDPTTIEEPDVLVYNANSTPKKKKLIELSNEFFSEVSQYNFFKYGLRGVSPITYPTAFAYLKSEQGVLTRSNVSNYFGTGNYDSYHFFVGKLKESDIHIKGCFLEKRANFREIDYQTDIEALNSTFKKDYKVLNDVFLDKSKVNGFLAFEGNFYWANTFTELQGRYAFDNADGTVSAANYLRGNVVVKLSRDGSTLRIFINNDTYVDVTKDIYSEYDNEKQNDFGDLFYDLEITIPEIQLKSIIRLENMVYKGNHHILSPTLNVGNVYFVTNFRTSKYGFLFGEQPEVNIDEPEQLETACYIGIPKLTLQSAFKMRVFHEDILIFEGIVDASQAYTY